MSKVFLSSVLVFSLVLVLGGCGQPYTHSTNEWRRFAVQLPDSQYDLQISIRPRHVFLAEYEYEVLVRRPNQSQIKDSLQMQTGGDTSVLVSWYPGSTKAGPFIRFQHKVGPEQIDELLDLKSGSKYDSRNNEDFGDKLSEARVSQGQVVGYIDNNFEYHKEKNVP
ncbi:MAG: hypothetical protein K2Y22_07445 [Candidatus Obscuribacterales bacterium]|nr:hypothetical protein [Candidatus Obscuribacterales bacterium]